MDDQIRNLASEIATHGWTVMRIAADGPGPDFAYSIGMIQNFEHPEVIIVGLPLDVAHELINDFGNRVRDGERFVAGHTYDQFLEGYSVTFRKVPQHQFQAYLGWGLRYYNREPFDVLQMVYPDRNRRWPWDNAVSEEFRLMQPILADSPEPSWANEGDGE